MLALAAFANISAAGSFQGGVGVHVGQNKNALDATAAALEEAHVTSFRDEVFWHRLERKKGVLEFPEDRYSDGKQEQTYRSSWKRDGDDAYFVLTEVRAGEGWKEAWRIRMERQK